VKTAKTWDLTVTEQRRLLEILAESPEPTQAFVEAMRRGDELFGPTPTTGPTSQSGSE
jgi:uncharacterized protein (DUF1778 family)